MKRRVPIDIDSSESPVHGAQEQSAHNGHFEAVCYHPRFVFNHEGDCLAAQLEGLLATMGEAGLRSHNSPVEGQ